MTYFKWLISVPYSVEWSKVNFPKFFMAAQNIQICELFLKFRMFPSLPKRNIDKCGCFQQPFNTIKVNII